MPEVPGSGEAQENEATVTLAEVRFCVVWNLRGDPAQSTFVGEAQRCLGLPLPLQPNTSERNAATALLWLGPRAWLFIAGADSPRDDFDGTRRRLNDAGGALFDVSASYAAWSVSGDAAMRVLNRSCPLDLHPRVFSAGHCAQSVLGHVNAVFYRPDEAARLVVMVGCSFAADAWADLTASAASDGYRIGTATPFGAV